MASYNLLRAAQKQAQVDVDAAAGMSTAQVKLGSPSLDPKHVPCGIPTRGISSTWEARRCTKSARGKTKRGVLLAAPQGLGLGLQPLLWMQRSMANSLK